MPLSLPCTYPANDCMGEHAVPPSRHLARILRRQWRGGCMQSMAKTCMHVCMLAPAPPDRPQVHWRVERSRSAKAGGGGGCWGALLWGSGVAPRPQSYKSLAPRLGFSPLQSFSLSAHGFPPLFLPPLRGGLPALVQLSNLLQVISRRLFREPSWFSAAKLVELAQWLM